ncbi:MAG TPA: DMT family transporter [Solirubrobacteraceae bacterium]|nr:DMT family transporter [Solirubrobacteraceae bacterium]
MSKTIALFAALAAGTLVGMQAPVNSRLARSVGSLQAATVSFLVGTLALVLIAGVFAHGGLGALGGLTRAPAWALIGGLFGAVYVAVALITVRTLGATGLSAAVITGQLAISVAIDRFGLLGLPRAPVSATRIIGLALLVAGVVLVVRR